LSHVFALTLKLLDIDRLVDCIVGGEIENECRKTTEYLVLIGLNQKLASLPRHIAFKIGNISSQKSEYYQLLCENVNQALSWSDQNNNRCQNGVHGHHYCSKRSSAVC
jgi:hypothetical protein